MFFRHSSPLQCFAKFCPFINELFSWLSLLPTKCKCWQDPCLFVWTLNHFAECLINYSKRISWSMKQTSEVRESERALWMGWEQSRQHLKKVYLPPVPSTHSANLLLPWIFKPSCQQQREQLQWQSWQVPSWCPHSPTLASGSVWGWGGGDAACIAVNEPFSSPAPYFLSSMKSVTCSPWRAQNFLLLTWVCQMLQMFEIMLVLAGRGESGTKKKQQLG